MEELRKSCGRVAEWCPLGSSRSNERTPAGTSLTRDHRADRLRFPEIAISVKIAIFDVPDFFVKKKSGKSVFWTPGPKVKF